MATKKSSKKSSKKAAEAAARKAEADLLARDELYVDFDDETSFWCVFGTESGHCYASFCDEEVASSWMKPFKAG